MPKTKAESSPVAEPEAPRIRAEGDEGGYPQQVFDPERKALYFLNTLRERVYIGVPEGFAWNDDGTQLLPAE